MARDDSPATSTAVARRPPAARRPQQHGGQCAVKWNRNLKPKLAIMRQCTSVPDRRTDGLASWHKREMYILHLALKTHQRWLQFRTRLLSVGHYLKLIVSAYLANLIGLRTLCVETMLNKIQQSTVAQRPQPPSRQWTVYEASCGQSGYAAVTVTGFEAIRGLMQIGWMTCG